MQYTLGNGVHYKTGWDDNWSTSQRLHNRARTIIENARHKDYVSEDWKSVEDLFRFDWSVITYKILIKMSPESLWDKFELRYFHSTYATRNCKDLQIPKIKTELMRISFQYSAVEYWSNMPVLIRETSGLKSFKKQLKTYLKSL